MPDRKKRTKGSSHKITSYEQIENLYKLPSTDYIASAGKVKTLTCFQVKKKDPRIALELLFLSACSLDVFSVSRSRNFVGTLIFVV